jgi:hypothetical protein
MARGPLGDGEVAQYHRDGYVLVRRLFDEREIGLLRRAAEEDKALDDHSFGRADAAGGAWEWHQDYGYWYQNGVLFPLLTSVFIAVDPVTTSNGCLQVLGGSHLCGRVDHVLTGDQAGADRERVAEIARRLSLSSTWRWSRGTRHCGRSRTPRSWPRASNASRRPATSAGSIRTAT